MAAAFDMAETPTMDAFEDDTTVPRRKKRRSSARRVSFAEIQTVHVFPRDDDYSTPPGGVAPPQPLRKSPRLAARRSQSLDSIDQNPVANAAPEDGDEAAGPVDINHIVQSSLESPSLEDDITLDSNTFSAKLSRFPDAVPEKPKIPRRSGSLDSDMSFTVQDQRRQQPMPMPASTESTPVSLQGSLTMQYTEMVDAGALAQKRRRVFRASPRFKGKENRSPLSSATSNSPRKIVEVTEPIQTSPMSCARSGPSQKLIDIAMSPQSSWNPMSPARSIQARSLKEITSANNPSEIQVPASPISFARSTPSKRIEDIDITLSSGFGLPPFEAGSGFELAEDPLPRSTRLLDAMDVGVAPEVTLRPRSTPAKILNDVAVAAEPSSSPLSPVKSSPTKNIKNNTVPAEANPSPFRVAPRIPSSPPSLARSTPVKILAVAPEASPAPLRQAPPTLARSTPAKNLNDISVAELRSSSPSLARSTPAKNHNITLPSPPPLREPSSPPSLARSSPTKNLKNNTVPPEPSPSPFRVAPRIPSSPPSLARSTTPAKNLKNITPPSPPPPLQTASSPPSLARSTPAKNNAVASDRPNAALFSPPFLARSEDIALTPEANPPPRLRPSSAKKIVDFTAATAVPSNPASASRSNNLQDRAHSSPPSSARSVAPLEIGRRVHPEELLKSKPAAPSPAKNVNAVKPLTAKRKLPGVNEEKELTTLRSKLQEIEDENDQLKSTLDLLEQRKRDLSAVLETCKFEQTKRRMIHRLQGWNITGLVSERDSYKLEISHGNRVNQSLTIDGKRSAWIQLTPDLILIEKGFPRMNCPLLFQSLLPTDKHRIKQLKGLPAAMQQTSELVMNLIEIAKEARDCREQHRCLESVLFMFNKDHGICLQFDFVNYRLRLKITLVFSLQSLNNGLYPKDIIPCEVLVDSTRRAQSVITEQDLVNAFYSVPAGYQRFHRICACVDNFLP